MIAKQDQKEKKYDEPFGYIRLSLLILHLIAITTNLKNQSQNILKLFLEIQSSSLLDNESIAKQFKAANTLALVFTIMQLIILYVGTNRFRVKSTIYTTILHFIGFWFYMISTRWQFQNIWFICGVFSFIPAISEIIIALYTAKS